MRYEEVMRNIIESLTGDSLQDIAYLRQQMEFYKGHVLAPEILQGINHLIYHLLPEETKKEIELALQRNSIRNERTLKEAESFVRHKDYQNAATLLESLIEEEDGPGSLFHSDSVSEYYAFHNFFEEALFRELYHFRKVIRPVPGDFSKMYFLYGHSLLELGKIEEAKEALEKSLRWNPMNLKPLFEQIELSRVEKDEDRFFCIIKRCFRSAYTSADLARCYRSLGQYHLDKGENDLADTLFTFSMAFVGDNSVAPAEIRGLTQKMRKSTGSPPRLTEIWEACEERDGEIGPNRLVLDLAVSLGQKAMKEGAYVSARFLFGIAYDLTKDEKIRSFMDELPPPEDMM